MTPDHVNGCFELLGGVLQWRNVATLWRDREVKGVDWRVTGFHVTWGAWNIYFYDSVNAPWSVAGAVGLLLANTAWVWMAVTVARKS